MDGVFIPTERDFSHLHNTCPSNVPSFVTLYFAFIIRDIRNWALRMSQNTNSADFWFRDNTTIYLGMSARSIKKCTYIYEKSQICQRFQRYYIDFFFVKPFTDIQFNMYSNFKIWNIRMNFEMLLIKKRFIYRKKQSSVVCISRIRLWLLKIATYTKWFD